MELKNREVCYRPVLFIIGTFLITWCCAGFMERIDYDTHIELIYFLDFMENASPLFCALVLMLPYWRKDGFLWKFFLGEAGTVYSYFIVLILFVAQFLNFYLFQMEGAEFSIQTFAITFAGQLVFGGGLEEAGWRGYLFPCFCKNRHVLLSSFLVSIIWVLWHLPYFFISGSLQVNGNFLAYSLIGVITGFILSAIYLLTKSVLLCMLFHSWQNTIVMTVPADMGDMRFMLIFIFLGTASALLCLYIQKKQNIALSSDQGACL